LPKKSIAQKKKQGWW